MSDQNESKVNDEGELTPEQRLAWLRERGVLVETAEERKINEIRNIMKEEDIDVVDGEKYSDFSFVHVPHDEALPMKELKMKVLPSQVGKGDVLLEELKPFFSALSKKVDMSLFKDQATKHFGSGDTPMQVSEDALKSVATQGQVESFCLVQPMPSNKFTSVNVYLDEVGLLKRLPMNKRGGDIALKAGFNPAPKFYGDVFIGRLNSKPVLTNADFKLGADTSPNAEWLQRATMENLEYQASMTSISGKTDQVQPSADGEDGIAKTEEGGLYSWTQTDEEIEIVLPLGSTEARNALSSKDVKAGGLKVKYNPRNVNVKFKGVEILNLKLYANIDPDGCTWTLDIGSKETSLVISCEKVDPMSWPRINI